MAKKSAKILKQDDTYRDTPYRVMQAIERTIGRKLYLVEIGEYYRALHWALDHIDARGKILVYVNKGTAHTFTVVFNSEQTVLICKV